MTRGDALEKILVLFLHVSLHKLCRCAVPGL